MTLVGYAAAPSSEFAVALHEALDAQTTVTAEEMDRICGG